MISVSLIKRISYVYLLIPIFIFGVGWLNNVVAPVFGILLAAGLVSIWKKKTPQGYITASKWNWILALFLLFFWVFLSGIGGYAFQNWDHHSRNAVFRDLINFSWPVRYHIDLATAAKYHIPSSVILVYYFGFWLPAALVGKVTGWGGGNLFLLGWSLLGVFLATSLISYKTRLSIVKASLLLIFFSGMDAVGTWLFQWIPNYDYPGFWPPIQHLEWWAGSYQYSSFTTSLFWTYNQFVPAIVVLSLFFTLSNVGNVFFLYGYCFFFAPLPAIGLIPFIAVTLVRELSSSLMVKRQDIRYYLYRNMVTFENLAGLTIAFVAWVFYSTNLSAQSRDIQYPSPFLIYLIFILLEGMLIWLLLLPQYRKDWMWYAAGLVLAFAPFFKVGESWDLVMRTSLPSLFTLMIGCGSFLAEKKMSKIGLLVTMLLGVGALTPLYEINRSLVRTDRHDGYLVFSSDYFEQYFHNPPVTNQDFIPEVDHLYTLTADEWQSVSIPNDAGWETKVGSLFEPPFDILWKDELIQK